MLTSKKMALKPLIESTDGVHLTAYIVNRGDLGDLQVQLQETIDQAHEWLTPAMSEEERVRFLEPLSALVTDTKILPHMKSNIGIFRNRESFRVLNIPVEVEQACQVATTFHVKPLLKWLQSDQDFLLLGIEAGMFHLYSGSQTSIKPIDSLARAQNMGTTHLKLAQNDLTFAHLNQWIDHLTTHSQPKLFLAGEDSLVEQALHNMHYKKLVRQSVAPYFNRSKLSEICAPIRDLLKYEAKTNVEKALTEFRFAEEGNRTRKNIFQIAKAVVQGKVRKLIVTDELNIFGKIDRKSGGLAIHPIDMDHEDDDILDDLAQMVLSQGGEVTVASRHEIPKGRPILAILDDDGVVLEKTAELEQLNRLQERFG